jgi:hypothetical protein
VGGLVPEKMRNFNIQYGINVTKSLIKRRVHFKAFLKIASYEFCIPVLSRKSLARFYVIVRRAQKCHHSETGANIATTPPGCSLSDGC